MPQGITDRLPSPKAAISRPLNDRVSPSPVNVERQEFAVPAAHHEIQGLQYFADFRWSKRPFGGRLIDASGYGQFMIEVRSNLRHNDLLTDGMLVPA